jgi:hypothetical protein
MKADGGSGQRPLPPWRNQLDDFRFHYVSQNARGLSPDKEEVLAALMKQHNVFVFVVQETWCEEEATTEKAGCTFIRTSADRSAARGRASGDSQIKDGGRFLLVCVFWF